MGFRQFRDTGNIGHKTQNDEVQNNTSKTQNGKKMSNMDVIAKKTGSEPRCS
jgi:hypothetical protein